MFRRSTCFLAALSIGLSAYSASAQPQRGGGPMMECSVNQNFSDSDTIRQWRAVNDGVMGGLSFGGPRQGDGHMVFAGTINTDGGGFSSIRTPMTPGALSGADGIALRLRSDGRDYKLTFRTSERWRGRSVSYQAPIPATPEGEWTDVVVPFRDLDTSVFGRAVRAAGFDPSDVREMGIILADGRDGPFELAVQRLSCSPAD